MQASASGRSSVVASLHRHLARYGQPRLEMMALVVCTGLAGFAASAALLALGVTSMPLRYVLLVSGLYHRLRTLDRRSWLTTAVSRTWRPAIVAVVMLGLGGLVAQTLVPHARSIGEVMQALA